MVDVRLLKIASRILRYASTGVVDAFHTGNGNVPNVVAVRCSVAGPLLMAAVCSSGPALEPGASIGVTSTAIRGFREKKKSSLGEARHS